MDKRSSSLKDKLASVTPVVDDLKMKKEERLKQFADIKAQIERISGEISGYHPAIGTLVLEEQDLSLRRLNEFQTHLRTLQKEKVRLLRLLEIVLIIHKKDLCCAVTFDKYSFHTNADGPFPSFQLIFCCCSSHFV